MLDEPLSYKYRLRVVHDIDVLLHYEIVDMHKAIVHSSNQVVYITKDYHEADRYCAMLNKQDKIERN